MLAILFRPLCVNEMIQHNSKVFIDSMCQEAEEHWGGDVSLMKFSSLASPEVVKNGNFRCGLWEELRRDGGLIVSNNWTKNHICWRLASASHQTTIRHIGQATYLRNPHVYKCIIRWCHDDIIKWKHFPRNWPFVRGIHRSRCIPHTKASDAELWCFLWSASE